MDVEEIFVQAVEADEHALDFYRSTGAQSQKVVHFYYPLS
jgi:aminoglycoside 3-N-acetyltransferase I